MGETNICIRGINRTGGFLQNLWSNNHPLIWYKLWQFQCLLKLSKKDIKDKTSLHKSPTNRQSWVLPRRDFIYRWRLLLHRKQSINCALFIFGATAVVKRQSITGSLSILWNIMTVDMDIFYAKEYLYILLCFGRQGSYIHGNMHWDDDQVALYGSIISRQILCMVPFFLWQMKWNKTTNMCKVDTAFALSLITFQ